MLAAPARAQDSVATIRDWLRPRATLRSSAWSSSRRLDGRGPLFGATMWVELSPRLSEHVGVHAAGWGGFGSTQEPGQADARIRELYADIAMGPAELRAGKQIFAWGRADALNPTDNLTPRDFTLLATDDDEQKIGAPALRIAVTAKGTTVSAIWLAGFQGHTLPLGTLPPGTQLVRPTQGRSESQGAVRVEHAGGRVDWSASYFDGLDLSPDAALRETPSGSVLVLSYHRLRAVGADAATTLGRYQVRAEGALLLTENATGHDAGIQNSTAFAVLGADRTYGSYLNLNLQYVVRYVRGFTPAESIVDPARRLVAIMIARLSQQMREVQHGVTVRVSDQWLHETLKVEVAAVAYADPRQLLLRSRVTYALSDRWQVAAGADRFGGEVGSLFDSLRRNSLAFVEVRLGF